MQKLLWGEKYMRACISNSVPLKACYHLSKDNPEKPIVTFVPVNTSLLIIWPIAPIILKLITNILTGENKANLSAPLTLSKQKSLRPLSYLISLGFSLKNILFID